MIEMVCPIRMFILSPLASPSFLTHPNPIKAGEAAVLLDPLPEEMEVPVFQYAWGRPFKLSMNNFLVERLWIYCNHHRTTDQFVGLHWGIPKHANAHEWPVTVNTSRLTECATSNQRWKSHVVCSKWWHSKHVPNLVNWDWCVVFPETLEHFGTFGLATVVLPGGTSPSLCTAAQRQRSNDLGLRFAGAGEGLLRCWCFCRFLVGLPGATKTKSCKKDTSELWEIVWVYAVAILIFPDGMSP